MLQIREPVRRRWCLTAHHDVQGYLRSYASLQWHVFFSRTITVLLIRHENARSLRWREGTERVSLLMRNTLLLKTIPLPQT